MFSPAQGGADIGSVANSILAGKARAHAVTLVGEEFALEQGAALRKLDPALDGVRLEQLLHTLEGWTVKNSFVLSLEPFAGVMGLADVDAVLQEVGEGAVGEGNPAPVFCNFGLAVFGDNLAAIQFGHQLAEGFLLQIEPEDGADGFSLSLVDDQFLVLCSVTERHGAAGPFTLSPAGSDFVPHPLG